MTFDLVRISGRGSAEAARPQEAGGADDRSRPRLQGPSGDDPDRVQLSGLASVLSAGLREVAGSRAERVKALAAQVQSAGYTVDANRLSAALIANAVADRDHAV